MTILQSSAQDIKSPMVITERPTAATERATIAMEVGTGRAGEVATGRTTEVATGRATEVITEVRFAHVVNDLRSN